MNKRLAELEHGVDVGKPGAEQRLESFRAEKARLAESIVQVCLIISFVRVSLICQQSSVELEKWAKEEADVQARTARERKVQRRKE